jgi:hypothetical protein
VTSPTGTNANATLQRDHSAATSAHVGGSTCPTGTRRQPCHLSPALLEPPYSMLLLSFFFLSLSHCVLNWSIRTPFWLSLENHAPAVLIFFSETGGSGSCYCFMPIETCCQRACHIKYHICKNCLISGFKQTHASHIHK